MGHQKLSVVLSYFSFIDTALSETVFSSNDYNEMASHRHGAHNHVVITCGKCELPQTTVIERGHSVVIGVTESFVAYGQAKQALHLKTYFLT